MRRVLAADPALVEPTRTAVLPAAGCWGRSLQRKSWPACASTAAAVAATGASCVSHACVCLTGLGLSGPQGVDHVAWLDAQAPCLRHGTAASTRAAFPRSCLTWSSFFSTSWACSVPSFFTTAKTAVARPALQHPEHATAVFAVAKDGVTNRVQDAEKKLDHVEQERGTAWQTGMTASRPPCCPSVMHKSARCTAHPAPPLHPPLQTCQARSLA